MRVANRIAGVLCVVVALGSLACANKDLYIGSTYDPLARFPAQAQWSWDDSHNRLPNYPYLEPLHLDPLIRSTAKTAFEARGWTEAPQGSGARYQLSYTVAIGEVLSTTSASARGSVSLRLVDTRTGVRVWVGFVQADVDVSRTDEERKALLQADMHNLLKKFPPSQPKKK